MTTWLWAPWGGHWADRNPDPDRPYLCIMAAAIWTTLIILISGLLIVTVSTNLLVPAVTRQRYDLIMVDAYQDITIPFQMSSTEFFTMVSNHLNPGRVMPGHDGQNELDRYHHQGGRPLPTVPLARGIQKLVRGSLERSDWVLSALGAWKRKRGIRIWPKNSADEENRRVSGSGR